MAILVISPTHRDRRELEKIIAPEGLIFDEYSSEELEKFTYEEGHEEAVSDDMGPLISRLIAKYSQASLSGIVSTDDYPGSIIASILANEFGLRAPTTQALLACQHKYYSRLLQKQAVPEAVPQFSLVDPNKNFDAFPLAFPCFLKPVKSYFSCFAQAVHSLEELTRMAPCSLPNPAFLKPLNQLLTQYSNFELSADYLIAEELLRGMQATIEGYAFDGRFGFMGVVDSIMYPGTICFKQFLYPSRLPQEVQKKAEDLAERCMRHMGFDNGIFNIEFFYDPTHDRLQIIEINPRMASQFADLYEKVDGTNTYEVALCIARGVVPKVKKGQGYYAVAASCVLRHFSNMRVKKVPSEECIKALQEHYPETLVEVLVREGRRLSEELQDGKSYRYGLIQLGADDAQDLEERFEFCQKLLDFQFE